MSVIGVVLMLIGSIFSVLGALGIVRFPDVLTRLHAAAKVGPLGAGLVLVGAGFASGDLLTLVRTLVGLVFLILVSPVSAHLLARAALRSGTPMVATMSIDEFEDSR